MIAKLKTILLASFLALAIGCAATDTHRSAGDVLDDSAISSKIKAALLADGETDGIDIELEVDEGRVQLNGFADSKKERARAEEIARSSAGVVSVTNNLRIAEESRSVGRYLDDKIIVARVNTALAKSDSVKALDIEVEVNRGVVLLGGYVDSREERNAAGDAARSVEGIDKVVNNIDVR